MDKHERWRKKNIERGLCPCCGKLPAPGFKQCFDRINFKRVNRILNNECKRSGTWLIKAGRGLFASKDALAPCEAKP